jgi:hypothetical protein
VHYLCAADLSLVSPRLFWSFAYHFPFHHPHDVLRSGALCPGRDVDWKHLERRRRGRSEKARENRRQEKEREGGGEAGRAAEEVEALEEEIADRMEGAGGGFGGGGRRAAKRRTPGAGRTRRPLRRTWRGCSCATTRTCQPTPWSG